MKTNGLVNIRKRDMAEDYDSSIKEAFAENDSQDLKFCMKDSACMAIQYCDKTLYKVYGTCEFNSWFLAKIAVIVLVIVIAGILITLRKQLKALCNRNAPGDFNDSAEMQQLNQENPELLPASGPSVRERVQNIEGRV